MKRLLLVRPTDVRMPFNRRFGELLEKYFPDYRVDVLDVRDSMRHDIGFGVLNSLFTLRLYGREILARRKRFAEAFVRTPYLFKMVRRRVEAAHRQGLYDFSIQTQSMFDASVAGVPHYVYTDHTHLQNLDYEGYPEADLYHESWIRAERTVYERAAGVFTRTHHTARSLVEDYGTPADKVHCVLAGPNSPYLGKSEGLTSETIVFVGRDWERKGGPTLLAAFEKVRQLRPNAELVIVGPEFDTSLPGVRTTGLVTVEEVASHLRQAAVFCMPTHHDKFSLAVIEAMACGLPVVATDFGALPELVPDGEAGFLVTPGDSQALAARLVQLLESPARREKMGARARQIWEEEYNWQAVCGRIRRVVHGHTSRGDA